MTNERFTGTVALVTGAGEGIGLAIARALAANGARVAVNDLDPIKAQAVAAELGANGLAIPGDAADLTTIESLVADTLDQFGRLDLLVANAGLTLDATFLDTTPEAFDRVTGLNLRGSFFLAQAAARHMIHQGEGGRILIISSVCGHIAAPGLGVYGLTKAALEHLTRVLAVELGPHQIAVNALAPGATITPRNLDNQPDYAEHWAKLTPQGRCPEVEDMAHAALFLLDPTGGVLSGQTLIVDGGWNRTVPI